MTGFELSKDTEFALMVVWGIVLAGLVLNFLSCWLCCCCRTFDRLRFVLAAATGITLVVALFMTAFYTQDLPDIWSAATVHRSLFANRTRPTGDQVLKTLKWAQQFRQ